MPYCTNCGCQLKSFWRNCPNCGAPMRKNNFLSAVHVIVKRCEPCCRAVRTCFRKYVDFTGRASRSEFWYWILFCALVSLLETTLLAALPKEWTPEAFLIKRFVVVGSSGYVFQMMYAAWFASIIRVVARPLMIALFLPTVAVSIRRLHDLGLSCALTFFYYLCRLAIFLFSIATGQYLIAHIYDTSDNMFLERVIIFGPSGALFMLRMIAACVMCIPGKHSENKYGPAPGASREDVKEEDKCENTNDAT